MRIATVLFILSSLSCIDAMVYMYNTADRSAVELYDCILHETLLYCRRPTSPINLNRAHYDGQCFHGGRVHSLTEMYMTNISTGTVLHQWKSGFEGVEKYSFYTRHPNTTNGYICECTNPYSFGKYCEYLLSNATTFADMVASSNTLKRYYPKDVQIYGDIICYTTLSCDFGLLCLDWRDICDGTQQCMSALDENNCDKLEFNECEDDEYRCTNGMCIPEEYFLDGDFDCLDWSDEIQYYDDTACPIETASFRCDERFCPPHQWSCGDGQCIFDRLHFQNLSQVKPQCRSRREQHFMCETHYAKHMWTLPSGRCYENEDYEESQETNRTLHEQCQYHLRCALSRNAEKHCSCKNNLCNDQLNETCLTSYIQYPERGIIAPYILSFYNRKRNSSSVRPDFFWINGTVRCENDLIRVDGLRFSYVSTARQIVNAVCRYARNESTFLNVADDQFCPTKSLTFDNRSYSSSTICNRSRVCISTYRIRDGNIDCIDNLDEKANYSIDKICSKLHRFRFQCSSNQPTCLSVTKLGDTEDNCENSFDELWFGTSMKLVDIKCNQLRTDECKILRQYIENSWITNNTSHIIEQLRIPFRSYCDTFWNLAMKEDENLAECKQSWICSDDQWQCDTGQCIYRNWVLDGEWDCFDASDEFDPLTSTISNRNLQVISYEELINKSIALNRSSPFYSLCNLTTEFPCLILNSTSRSVYNFSYNRPCIHRQRLGDNRIDCYGAIDERNTIQHCNQSTMLGYHFKCHSTDQCIPYWDHCFGSRCTRNVDDGFWCDYRQNSSNCNQLFDFTCFNGTCIKGSRCNRILDCSFGEDEYMCEYQKIGKLTDVPYRKDKLNTTKYTHHKLKLMNFPSDSNETESIDNSNSDTQSLLRVTPKNTMSTPIPFWCNRGVGVRLYNDSIVCFCPPQYYGDKCQYHSDRISILIHLNLSQSIYTVNSDISIVLKLLVLFVYHEEIITSIEFHVRPAAEMNVYTKKRVHFLYSRSNRLLQNKIERYRNESDIINNHPYSIRIEMYERNDFEEPILIATWKYPIYFDYLPVYRFSKVIRLPKLPTLNNPCSSNPCNENQICQQLINDQTKYICLCKSNFTGKNCSILDQQCIRGYCAQGALCKPNYRGLISGNQSPYCVCSFNMFGERCSMKHDQCRLNPCLNNGSCFPTSKPNTFACICTKHYHGKKCELKNPGIKLFINETVHHTAAVIQYFRIDFVTLNLILVHQEVYRTLPKLIEYRDEFQIAPEIILVKTYSPDIEFYIISINMNAKSINGMTRLNEKNRCNHIRTLTPDQNATKYQSPIRYHDICRINQSLFCFRDDSYLCICEKNHTRVDCLRYDDKHDQCSYCLAGGRCIKGKQNGQDGFICLCPSCHSGIYCQFNSNSFAFTLDQLFYIDLISSHRKIVVRVLISIPLILFLIALPNNLFSIITLRRKKCLGTGISQYLLCMSVFNQLSLGLLTIRLIHLAVNITGTLSRPSIDNYLCKILSYLLSSTCRIVYWLGSLVAIERVYMSVFLNGRWLHKPYVARCLLTFTIVGILISHIHELMFVKSLFGINNGNGGMCVFEFPISNRARWLVFHLIISIINTILPLLINFCCTITISCIMTRKKMKTRMKTVYTTKTANSDETNEQTTLHFHKQQMILMNIRTNLRLLLDVFYENKEFIVGPGITLVPQLFSLPLFIISFQLYCQNLETSWIRYLLIASYLTSFTPQLISFMLYIVPSSFYSTEWYSTKVGRWMNDFFQFNSSVPLTSAITGTGE